MSLPKRPPTLSVDRLSAERWLAHGLAGSHRHFLRTWSNCLVHSGSHSVDEGFFAPRGGPSDDAYTIAARCLAGWIGQPWTSELVADRPMAPPHRRLSFLLTPTPIARQADVKAAVGTLLARRSRVPALGRDSHESFLNALCTLVSEMGQNVCEHSGSMGCVAVCWHEGEGDAQTLVSVGIVDAGIGIRASIVERLRAVGQRTDLSDAEAIARALELPYPVNEGNRGWGLRMSRDLIHRHRGVMHIRSGSAVVSMGPPAECLVGRCAPRHVPVPGAQICVYLTPWGVA